MRIVVRTWRRHGRTGPRGSLLVVTLLVAGVLAVGCAGRVEQAPAGQATAVAGLEVPVIRDISLQEAFELIEKNRANPDFAIIDVRTPDEFDDGHIEGAVMIDYYGEDFRGHMDGLDRGKTYLIYCRSGRRSAGARDVMEELGFREVYHMFDGIEGWIAEGLPVVK